MRNGTQGSKSFYPRAGSLFVWLMMAVVGFGLVIWWVGPHSPELVYDSIGVRGPVHFRFTQPVNIDNLESDIQFDPDVTGRWQVRGNEAWFWPAADLVPGSALSVKIAPRPGVSLLSRTVSYNLKVRAARILMLSPVSSGSELWVADQTGGNAVQLTQTGGRIYDFAVSFDGNQIVYSAENDLGGTSLWVIDRDGGSTDKLVDCEEQRCITPAWMPDSSLVFFSRGWSNHEGLLPIVNPQLWSYDFTRQSAEPILTDSGSTVTGYVPTVSPSGRWLSVYNPTASVINVLSLEGDPPETLSTRSPFAGSWIGEREQLVFLDIEETTLVPFTPIYLADLATSELRFLLPDLSADYEFGPPMVSPDGEWLAISSRSRLGQPGRQLWRVRLDGKQLEELTADSASNHAAYRWSPNGEEIVFQRYLLGSSLAQPEVVLWRAEDSSLSIIRTDAALPAWLP